MKTYPILNCTQWIITAIAIGLLGASTNCAADIESNTNATSNELLDCRHGCENAHPFDSRSRAKCTLNCEAKNALNNHATSELDKP